MVFHSYYSYLYSNFVSPSKCNCLLKERYPGINRICPSCVVKSLLELGTQNVGQEMQKELRKCSTTDNRFTSSNLIFGIVEFSRILDLTQNNHINPQILFYTFCFLLGIDYYLCQPVGIIVFCNLRSNCFGFSFAKHVHTSGLIY